MNKLQKIVILAVSVVVSACGGTRIVYKDNYFPVPYAVKLIPCDEPQYSVALLDQISAANDGIYVQAHVADDRKLLGYAQCNSTVIKLYNEAAAEKNRKTLENIPPAVLPTLSPEIKQVLSDNQ